MVDYFIQRAIKHPGRSHEYLAREFGDKAFTKEGNIKEEYFDKGIQKAKEAGNTSLERALTLGKRLAGYAREKEAYA